MMPECAEPESGTTTVALYCSSLVTGERQLAAAEDLGRHLAKAGHRMVYGGGTQSAMGAAAVAAKEGGSALIGVTLPQFVERDEPAPFVLVAPDLAQRKATMERLADAFLVHAGGIGTLDELFSVWAAAALGYHRKPIVVFDPDGVWAPLWDLLDGLVAAGYVSPATRALVRPAPTAEDAVAAVTP
jgi:uncharacterized protein (TIGR00730 family)